MNIFSAKKPECSAATRAMTNWAKNGMKFSQREF